jgi:hypothetical protein
MAVLGSLLVSWAWGDVNWRLVQGLFLYVGVPYVVFWTLIAFLVKRQTYLLATGLGLLSPLICSSFFLLVGWIIVLQVWYIAFPIGIVTGLLVKVCVSVGEK